jgi:hypothetical protein
MSIDKSSKDNINDNLTNPWTDFLYNNNDLISSTVRNYQLFWSEFWKTWNVDYDNNPFPKYTYMYVYYEIFVKPFFQKTK